MLFRSKSVYLIHRRGELRAQQATVQAARERENITFLLESRVVELLGEQSLRAAVVADRDGGRRELAVEGLFIEVGQEPDNGAFAPLAQLDDRGYFLTGEDCLTKTPGVFVAGDCRGKGLRQLTTAVADGAVAGTAACRYLG